MLVDFRNSRIYMSKQLDYLFLDIGYSDRKAMECMDFEFGLAYLVLELGDIE